MSGELWTLEQVVEQLSVDGTFVEELVRERIVLTDGDRFTLYMVERIRVCWNLHDLGVNLPGIEVALGLLDRLDEARGRRRR